jgi:hypothetical protein
MTFDDLAPTGVKSLTELPLFLSPINNPGVWDGWEVYGYDQNVQIDNLRSYLFPYADFGTNNVYIDDSRL